MIKSREEKFTEIYKSNFWASSETVSGGGSEIKNTQNIIKELPLLLKKYNIETLLDCACGDCNWIKTIDLPIKKYIGIDIVKDIISYNNFFINNKVNNNNFNKLKKVNAEFIVMDFVENELPKVDLILCKDVFIHLENKDIIKALKNFKLNGAKYLLVTNSLTIEKNEEGVLGGCRGMNLELEPFNLSKHIDNISVGVANSNLTLFKLN